MKFIFSFLTLVLGLSYANSTFAQCGPTLLESNPKAMVLCEGITDTVTFSAIGTCTGNFEYQVLNSSNAVVQPWSPNDQYISTNLSTETYIAEVRCSTCPGVVIQDTFVVEIIPEPTITADTIVCYGTTAALSANEFPNNNMTWWDSETGGNILIDSSSYTTPPLFEDDTVYMQVSGSVTATSINPGSILITEAGLHGFPGTASADYLEISNLYNVAVNTTGWTVVISRSYTNINLFNPIIWNLPNSFAPCSMTYKSDVSSLPNYWGNNILWNPNDPGWAAIIDDQGSIVDFVSWGWSQAELATFAPIVNGNTLTIGPEWIGAGCSSACSIVGTVPYSISRNGTTDTNTSADFVCQATSSGWLNPGISCGWVSTLATCTQQVIIEIDSLPSGDTPDTTFINCYADIPAPDPSMITNVLDDYTPNPIVTYIGEVSDGNTCPETLTRTYQIADTCNFVERYHIIVINDTVDPVLEVAPANLSIQCLSDVPPIAALNWTDNCLGSGVVNGIEVSSGTTCPEILTRTWTVSDSCGNTVSQTQVITINDTIAPVIDPAPADLALQCPSDVPPMATLNWTDNCDGSGVLSGVEVSDGQVCPETITRTWTISDACGNTSTEVQVIVINDDTPPTASNLPLQQVTVLPPPDVSLVSDAADNCSTPIVEWVSDVSDNGFCPENIVRTYSVVDDCGNVTFVNRTFIVGDFAPNAEFTGDPTILNNSNGGMVEFSNQTTGATDYMWDFGDGSQYVYDRNTSHQFDISQNTTYEVWMVATSQFGCKDSSNLKILVFQELLYYIPNAFTPDYDMNNQVFKPIFTTGFDPNDYNFKVFNRWGEILFESNNQQVGWDGTYNGKICKDGTYIYVVEFGTEKSPEREVATGHFTLLR
ncbi:HYR-like domain-containing protein [Brumimicrobium mesophilum]|uniref:HYR-like domain-containing protein n=1 Tax=Brumimicrobium mesophilum TaxID=392717 RepID=UPI000D13FC96|nr:T9SS type B sorting domain-containing protein [Brumimicrobium mesophilum]